MQYFVIRSKVAAAILLLRDWRFFTGLLFVIIVVFLMPVIQSHSLPTNSRGIPTFNFKSYLVYVTALIVFSPPEVFSGRY